MSVDISGFPGARTLSRTLRSTLKVGPILRGRLGLEEEFLSVCRDGIDSVVTHQSTWASSRSFTIGSWSGAKSPCNRREEKFEVIEVPAVPKSLNVERLNSQYCI